MSRPSTIGVERLLGDPKGAILRLSVPMMVGMFFQALYNVVDAIWVAGLGADALAAVGLFFPFFMLLMALATGLGTGGSSAISRRIGAEDHASADNAAVHTYVLGLGIALLISLPFIPFFSGIFRVMGAGQGVIAPATAYAQVLFGGAVFIFFSNIGTAVLRGEGDARRAMVALIIGAGLNILLDPLFIYVLGLGVVGAAWATLLSMVVSAALIFFWLFVRRDTFVRITWSAFRPEAALTREILRVGVPSTLSQLSMSLAMFALNWIILRAGGDRGIAVFTSGWRTVTVGTIPLLGMATGVTAVTGAAYGARDRTKLRIAYLYAVRLGILIELAAAALVAVFATPLAYLFTYAEGSAGIRPDLVTFLRLMTIFLPTVPLGMLTSAMFNGIGQGEKALVTTILRTLVLQVIGAYVIAIVLDVGLVGAWWGILIGNVTAGGIAFAWGWRIVGRLRFPDAVSKPGAAGRE